MTSDPFRERLKQLAREFDMDLPDFIAYVRAKKEAAERRHRLQMEKLKDVTGRVIDSGGANERPFGFLTSTDRDALQGGREA